MPLIVYIFKRFQTSENNISAGKNTLRTTVTTSDVAAIFLSVLCFEDDSMISFLRCKFKDVQSFEPVLPEVQHPDEQHRAGVIMELGLIIGIFAGWGCSMLQLVTLNWWTRGTTSRKTRTQRTQGN